MNNFETNEMIDYVQPNRKTKYPSNTKLNSQNLNEMSKPLCDSTEKLFFIHQDSLNAQIRDTGTIKI